MIKIIPQFLKREAENPGPRRVVGDRIIYESRIFSQLQGPFRPVLVGFGCAQFEEVAHDKYIQQNNYRAPEVILGASWSYSVDI